MSCPYSFFRVNQLKYRRIPAYIIIVSLLTFLYFWFFKKQPMNSYQLLFLDISGGEFMVILIAIFFIFGPKKMPEIARKIGRTMNELKKASSDITREFKDETNSIKNELLAARESVRRETDVITKDISETMNKAGKNLTTDIPVAKDPYPDADSAEKSDKSIDSKTL